MKRFDNGGERIHIDAVSKGNTLNNTLNNTFSVLENVFWSETCRRFLSTEDELIEFSTEKEAVSYIKERFPKATENSSICYDCIKETCNGLPKADFLAGCIQRKTADENSRKGKTKC